MVEPELGVTMLKNVVDKVYEQYVAPPRCLILFLSTCNKSMFYCCGTKLRYYSWVGASCFARQDVDEVNKRDPLNCLHLLG